MSQSVLRVFIERSWLDSGEKLLPLARYLFGINEIALPTIRDQFFHNMPFGLIELAIHPAQANFLYLPVNYSAHLVARHSGLISAMEEQSKSLRKLVVAESYSKDITNPDELSFPFSNGIYLNDSLIRSRSTTYMRVRPYFVPDCRTNYFGGQKHVLRKSRIPTVGFCGVAAPLKTRFNRTKIFDALRLISTIMDDFGIDSERVARLSSTNMKHAHRCKAVISLSYSKSIKFSCILRDVGGLVNKNYTNLSDFDSYNVSFYENLNSNLYSLCSRGTENYSIRFYETFCMGRIPVLIDTDLILPFQGIIDYEKNCVIVKKNEVRKISGKICDYHHRKSEHEIEQIQIENRDIWLKYFNPEGFYHNLARSEQIASA